MQSDKPHGFAVLPSHIVRNPDIAPQVKALLLALSSYTSGDDVCWPSQTTLATILGVSLSSVRQWLDEAEKAGLVAVQSQHVAGRGQVSNLYRLTFTKWGGVSAEYYPPCQPGDTPPISRVTTSNTIEQNHRNNRTPIVPFGDVGAGLFADAEVKPDLVATYNASCPNLPTCRGAKGSAAQKAADKAWKREPDLQLWTTRFKRAQASDFLTGRRGQFRADFLWLTNPTNVEKLDMGRYDNRTDNRTARGNAPVRTEDERTQMLEQDFSDFDAAIGYKEGK